MHKRYLYDYLGKLQKKFSSISLESKRLIKISKYSRVYIFQILKQLKKDLSGFRGIVFLHYHQIKGCPSVRWESRQDSHPWNKLHHVITNAGNFISSNQCSEGPERLIYIAIKRLLKNLINSATLLDLLVEKHWWKRSLVLEGTQVKRIVNFAGK